ncbi:MAG: phosphatase PAP2 family protein [Candidatus Taylorbacteria bacterium]|nr:phosphatase PAP2 family protein [Candidatus Taylorbacteria bacterium]
MEYLHFFSSLTDTLVSFAVGGGYIALFIILLFEGFPLVGIAIPGHVAVISAGFLVSTGVLNFFWVFIIALVGAVLGDYISFLLGRKFGWPLIERLRPFFFISESVITKARTFLSAHTGKALFFGRFNPVTRGLMPFFVGANRMSAKPFWIWNTIGAVVWVLSSVIIGYALGLGYHAASGWTSRALIIAIIAAILIVWGYRFVNVRFHIFRRYELFVLGLNLASLFMMFRMFEDAFSAEPFMAAFDLYVNITMNNFIAGSFGHISVLIASWISALGGTKMIIIFTIIGGIVLATHKKWRSVAILLLSMGSSVFLVGWIKYIILRIRPENFVTIQAPPLIDVFFDHASNFLEPSFPSGHAALAAAFFVVVTYLAVPKIKSWVNRELLIVVTVLLTIAIGISRIVISAHWATDVVAGWSLGIFCATASILFIRYVGTLIAGKIQQ